MAWAVVVSYDVGTFCVLWGLLGGCFCFVSFEGMTPVLFP